MEVVCRWLGRMEYAACWELQRSLFDAMTARKACRRAGGPTHCRTADEKLPPPEEAAGERPRPACGAPHASDDDPAAGTILLVEHPPVYTLGKSGRAENLLVDRDSLAALGAGFFHIDRGGDITFHGPGQLVCYPILDLERLGLGLRDYIGALEEAVIRTVAEYGIEAGRVVGASGVWLGEGAIPGGRGPVRKICAIGVRASRYITMHGLALNVATDLAWFARINPCGFADRGATSIERETGRSVAPAAVGERLLRHLGATLGVGIRRVAETDGR